MNKTLLLSRLSSNVTRAVHSSHGQTSIKPIGQFRYSRPISTLSSIYAKKTVNAINQHARFSTVKENTVYITFVDQDGNRSTLPGIIGDTLLEVAKKHRTIVRMEGSCDGGGAPLAIQRTPAWQEITYGIGPTCFDCHVQIPSKYNDILPIQTRFEIEGLSDLWEDEYTTSSRLACQIVLDKRHDGMVVLVPDCHPTNLV